MSTSEIYRSVQISIVVLLHTAAFKRMIHCVKSPLKSFLEWVAKVAVPASRETMEWKVENISRTMTKLKVSHFLKFEHLSCRELGTELIHYVFRPSLAVHTYEMKDGQIWELFLNIFRERNLPLTLLNVMWLAQFVLESNTAKELVPLEMSILTALKAQIYFPFNGLCEQKSGKEKAEDRTKPG